MLKLPPVSDSITNAGKKVVDIVWKGEGLGLGRVWIIVDRTKTAKSNVETTIARVS